MKYGEIRLDRELHSSACSRTVFRHYEDNYEKHYAYCAGGFSRVFRTEPPVKTLGDKIWIRAFNEPGPDRFCVDIFQYGIWNGVYYYPVSIDGQRSCNGYLFYMYAWQFDALNITPEEGHSFWVEIWYAE